MKQYTNTVLDNIRLNYEKLFSAEKRAADYILANPEKTIMLNITELAQKSGSSEATVVRMCKHVGYQGYYQMRLLMSHDLGNRRGVYDKEEMLNSARRLFDSSAARVAALGEEIDNEVLVGAVRQIRMSRMVHVVAAGNTSPIAIDLGFRLERCGIPCSYSMIPEHFLNHVSLGTSDDSIIAISRSGVSKQVVQAMELAKKNRMHSIVISGEKHSQIAEAADYFIQVVDKNNKTPGMEPASHLPEMAVSDALLYVLRHFDVFVKSGEKGKETDVYGDVVELFLSEYKL
ncbi:MAG: MurR/RpiR family transcriptional regulator [Coprococcus sp.]|nr:MurR/RpiR family transcriptional regulator [Coprococcus sp.]